VRDTDIAEPQARDETLVFLTLRPLVSTPLMSLMGHYRIVIVTLLIDEEGFENIFFSHDLCQRHHESPDLLDSTRCLNSAELAHCRQQPDID
jgi:hypothetical protein